jgi:uncharacterized phage-associated protein
MAQAVDVAAYVMELLGQPCSTMKLQKLLYYSQGWSLAWDGQPAFDDAIEAWANGPVVPAVFQHHRGHFRVDPAEWSWGDPSALTNDQRETVRVVVDHYGRYSGQELSAMTHEERPWVEARGGVPLGARSTVPLDLDTMQDFFGDLAASD